MRGGADLAGHHGMGRVMTHGPQAPHPRVAFASRALEALWRGRLATRPGFDPDRLVSGAQARAGLDDLGDPAIWRTGLELLCEGLEGSARLNALGRTIAAGQLRAILRDRLLAQALWRRHPAILDVPIPSPILVIGQMRSGTTRMQRLLAADPAIDATCFYESWNPVPLRRLPWDDRRIRARAGLAAIAAFNPGFAAIHPTGIDEADEEVGLNSHSLFGSAFEAQWRIPRFARHCEHRDTVPVYREFRRLLQTIRWLRRDPNPRPWVIKLPQMTQDLAAVLAVFPDARVVLLDRAAEDLVASSANLVESSMRVQSDDVDPRWIGREWLDKIALRHGRTRAALSAFSGPVAAVEYEAVGRDWRGAMARVYRDLGLPLSSAAQAAMHAYTIRAARRPRAPRAARLGHYGLTPADVAAAMP